MSYRKLSDAHGRKLILAALKKHHGNISHVAVALDIPRRTIYYKLERWGIDPTEFRAPPADTGLDFLAWYRANKDTSEPIQITLIMRANGQSRAAHGELEVIGRVKDEIVAQVRLELEEKGSRS